MSETRFPQVETGENITRQVLADSPQLMTVAFRFAARGATGALHSHPHVQSTFVQSGRFRFLIDGRERIVAAGDAFVIAPNAVHGCVCLEPGTLIDTFSPRRDEFL